MKFRDRTDAGRRLAPHLERFKDERPLVVGLPRGGVVVALEVALALSAPLEVFVVRKLGAPFQPELGVGALAEDGAVWLSSLARELGIDPAALDEIIARERAEAARRVERFRDGRAFPDIRGRTVILVDDGIATGSTVRVAVRSLRARAPSRLVLAVPVATPESVAALSVDVDELVCLSAPEDLVSVGRWYREFEQVSDEEVVRCLARAQQPTPPRTAHEPRRAHVAAPHAQAVNVVAGDVTLEGELTTVPNARGIVLFVHGSGSSRRSPRNRYVAQELARAGLSTLLFDLLTEREELADRAGAELRFDIPFLAARVVAATDWVYAQPRLRDLAIGYFGASTGGAASLVAAAERPDVVRAVVSRGGRPDLAMGVLGRVRAPTLLLVGSEDYGVVELNRQAYDALAAERELVLVEGATHLFEEPGALEEVARLAAEWFADHLGAAMPRAPDVGRGRTRRA